MYPEDKKNIEYVEKKKHGDVLLPFVIYGTMMPTLFSSFPLHCHEEIEMVLNDCGKCRYTVSGEEIDLEFGDILVIMPWVLHSFRLTDENDYFLAATYLISLEMIANHNFDVCSSKYCLPILARKCNDTVLFVIIPSIMMNSSRLPCSCSTLFSITKNFLS